MSTDADGILKLLQATLDELAAVRKGADRAERQVAAIHTLILAIERGREAAGVAISLPPMPPPDQIRQFLQSLYWPAQWPERNDPDVVAVKEWLEGLADVEVKLIEAAKGNPNGLPAEEGRG